MNDFTYGPRPGFWRMFWRTGAVLPLILAVVTVILSFSSFGNLRDGLKFEAQGIQTSAEIIERYTQKVRSQHRMVTEYHLRYRYFANDGTHTGRQKVSEKVYAASDIGTTRTVRYLPDHPQTVEFEVGQTLKSGRNERWFALAVGLAMLGALWWKGGRAVDAIRARKFGTPERATVIDVLVHKGKNSTSYKLQWCDKNGTIATSLSSGTRSRYDPYPPHTSIEIYRGANGRAWWVGDIGPREDAQTVPSVGKTKS